MPRPCDADHPLSPGTCRHCFWCLDRTEKGARFRARWGEPEPPADAPAPQQAPPKPRMSIDEIVRLARN